MSQTMTNGDTSSQFIDHLLSYPTIHDSITAYKSHPYGARSLALSTTGYEKFVSPFVPYAKRPYGYISPYVRKADTLASDGLTKVDSRFPIVKEDTEKVKTAVLDLAYLPLRVVGDSKNYISSTYGSEYKKCGGDGYVASGKAVITTSLVITSDSLSWLSAFLGQKKDQGEDFAAKKYGQARNFAYEKSGNARQYAGEQGEAAMRFASEKAEQAKELAYQKTEEGKEAAGQAKQMAEQKREEAKGMAKEKAGK